ncbi:endonuclease V [Microbulbifer magnicolonia]|uniref:endonuclease V n=1 Tax=Microbulbifer magnicolonia TaxID=3109744 RepID=UPI002B40750B|nr:endonuclease V [Microbulbifer sp. GG15]
MILAVDVDYRGPEAVAAGVCFRTWRDEQAGRIYRSVVSEFGDYQPGDFYLRELPCILQLLREHHLAPDIIVIDGYVYLGDKSRPGLGMHLFNTLGHKIPVIGVAKKPFKGTMPASEILRGNSARPLYITAAGMDIDTAKSCILSMYGKHRTPTLLKTADRACRRF